MPNLTVLRFVTDMKLRELRSQRDELLAVYDSIERRAKDAPPSEVVKLLGDGLASVSLAGRRIHEDIGNLEAVLLAGKASNDLKGDSPTARFIDSWKRRLEREIDRGRRRCHVAYAFGAVLGDSAGDATSASSSTEDERQKGELDLRQAELAREPRTIDLTLVDQLLARLDLTTMRESAEALDHVDPERWELSQGVESALQSIGVDQEQSAEARADARDFRTDPAATKDLTDALRMNGAGGPDWRWPEGGVLYRAVWTGDRYRIHPALPFLELLGLEIIGVRIDAHLSRELRGGRSSRLVRIARLRELDAPQVILDAELRLLNRCGGLLAALSPLDESTQGNCIAVAREAHQLELMGASLTGGASYGYGSSTTSIVSAIQAEIGVRRFIAPDAPVFVLRADIADFFPSISHEWIEHVVSALGFSDAWKGFVARFLAVPVQSGEALQKVRCGVPLGNRVSRVLAEILMTLCELEVLGTRDGPMALGLDAVMFRCVDDIVIISNDRKVLEEAWRKLLAFLLAAGLSPNLTKCGALAINGEVPESLPKGPVRVQRLVLANDGLFHIDPEEVSSARRRIATRIEKAPTVLGAVQAYNSEMRQAVAGFAPMSQLGENHVAEVARVTLDIHDRLFGEIGIVEELRRRMTRIDAAPGDLPLAWFYWPLTAGGLGLIDPIVELAQIVPAENVELPLGPCAGPCDDLSPGEHADLYRDLLKPKEKVAPPTTPDMQARERDFIVRAAEMMAEPTPNPDKTLEPYWRWILATHGPDVIDELGSYRFLLHELVPLDLIRKLRSRSSA